MPTTPSLALPYPAPSDAPAGPASFQMLAEATESAALTLAVGLPSDAGYPVAATNITAETVLDRITIAAVPYARRLHITGHVYTTVSVANTQVNVILYSGAVQVGYARTNLAATGFTGSETIPVTGKVDLAANTATVIELRIVRQAGTGTITTSISAGLTNSNVLALRR